MAYKEDTNWVAPEMINSVSGLSLLAKTIAKGYTHGHHNSQRKGLGVEFSQFRSYEKGDDVRQLDWKMLARSGKYYIKESEVETNIKVQFVLDASDSMQHQEQGITKLQFAKVLIACLSYIFDRQGDHIGLASLNDMGMVQIPTVCKKNQWSSILKSLYPIMTAGKWPVHLSSAKKLHQRKHKELFVCLTDGYQVENELLDFFYYLKNPRNEVIVIQILGAKELHFDYGKQVVFEDLETGKRIKVDTQKSKEKYLISINDSMNSVRLKLQSKGIQYVLCDYSKPVEEVVHQLVQIRNRFFLG